MTEGKQCYQKTAQQVAQLRKKYLALTDADAKLDPTRLTICTENGYQVEKFLQEHNIWPEMADSEHVVFILTCADGVEEVERLEPSLGRPWDCTEKHVPIPPSPPRPCPSLSARQERHFSPQKRR